jgi:nitrogen fixation protein
LAAGGWSDAALVTLRDAVGRVIGIESWWGGAAVLDVSNLPRGWMLVTVSLPDGAQLTRRVLLD